MSALTIGYEVYESPFGLLLVAATPSGVCTVSLGADALKLEATLRDRYPHACLVRSETRCAGWGAELQRYFRQGGRLPSLPLDITGTSFQWRVWHALREIPAGTTQTYGQIAAQIGSPGAARAVGQACGRNPVVVLIPCHRVINKNGTLGGFGCGLQYKAALLEWERSWACGQS